MIQLGNRGKFFLLISLALILLLSLYFPPTAFLWERIDVALFTTLNSYIIAHPIQQVFWAAASIKLTDIFGALFLFGFFLLYVFEVEGIERRKRVRELLFCMVWFEIGMLLSKQVLTPYLIQHGFSRHSPTETLDHSFRLSLVLPWLKVKDSSLFSFPADHGAIVLQWCGFLWFFGSWQRGLLARCFSTIFLLPRLISGAHWGSDLFVGSLAWVLLLTSLALFSPMYSWTMRALKYLIPENENLGKEST